MAPIKFEENMRERLEQREIKPSAGAWERIEQDLDTSAKRKSKKNYGWLLLAASFIGLLILSGKFFFGVDQNQNPQVVEVPVEEIKIETDLPVEQKQNKLIDKELVREEVVRVQEKPAENESNPKGELSAKQKEALVITETSPEKEALEAPVQQKIDAEVDAIIAKVQEQQNAGAAYSDAEIDKLLRDAQRDIISEKVFDKERNAVSAEALLYEVEEELDPSFRDRVFEALKEGFLKAREAVASRNN